MKDIRKEPRAVVWDLDGVIVDSADAHNASWLEMAQEFGVDYDPATDFKGIFGKHNSDIIPSLWGVTDPAEIDRMAMSKESSFRREAENLKALPGVVELIKALANAGWRQGIGSSAPLENIRLLLEVTDLAGYMETIASGEDVSRGKPDPQVFLVAFERLGVNPRNGVVIEDAPAGVRAGKAAGAACLGVTTTQTKEMLLESGADRVVDSLTEINVSDLADLVAWNGISDES
ncbi:MAG: HAD family phosphatase [Chloroflexota bacterium]